ncbi:MAG: transpeptidase family protein [Bacteroides sp.]|nr:transpeptidase family protein [Prevotella sp.]MCM1408750.1 transpeptidase family protein [Treponema brennaborense]MCM1470665.1 transpeptidase family protein [Bacteroides sp.]
MPINSFYSKKRLGVIFVCLTAFALYIVFNYGKLAFVPELTQTAAPAETERGAILDRNGKPLAVQTDFYNFIITPSSFTDKQIDAAAQLFAPPLQMSAEQIAGIIRSSPPEFAYLKKKIDQNAYEQLSAIIKEHGIKGLRFDKVHGRIYPENSLASHAVGWMGDDGKGLSGIEYSMQQTLAPAAAKPSVPDVQHGKDIYLTIDANLQYKLDKVMRETLASTQAESLMLIAASAKTGEILSYISLPEVNLNSYPAATEIERLDRPTNIAYEPGSVFKIFSVAAIVSSGGVAPNNTFLCDGKYEIRGANGELIRIACLEHHGWLSAREALKYSCNDVIAQMSEHITAEALIDYCRAFGFGSKTGIELSGETRGLLRNPSDALWSGRSKPTIAMGQEISVSAVQMVQATTALANKGIPVQITLISKIVSHGGTAEYIHKPQFKNRIISEQVAQYLLSCMETTAKEGTGRRASLGDISIGVKTGTAQMIDKESGKYSQTDFLSNCMAVFPIEDPQIVLYIVITKAKGETYSGRIVAPVIANAADIIIDHLGLARANAASLAHSGLISVTQEAPVYITDTIPDFTGCSKRTLAPLLKRTDISFIISGDGWVISQNPPPGTPVTENMTVELILE